MLKNGTWDYHLLFCRRRGKCSTWKMTGLLRARARAHTRTHTHTHTHTLLNPLAPVWLLRYMYVLIIDSFHRKPSCLIKQVYLIVCLIQIFNFALTLLCSWLVYSSCPKIQPEWRPARLSHPNNLQYLICVPMLYGREESAEIQRASGYDLVPGSVQTRRTISRTG